MNSPGVGAAAGAGGRDLNDDGGLNISGFADELKKTINAADASVEQFITEKTDKNSGELKLSAGESLELQKLMAEQGVVSNVATGGLKGISDSEKAVARNI